jgi:hypothetical protein
MRHYRPAGREVVKDVRHDRTDLPTGFSAA